MPRRDLISINGFKSYGLNIFDSVGIGGKNSFADVMTIQTMFCYLYELWEAEEYSALKDLRKHFFLQPDGLKNPKTINAIIQFQQFFSWKVLGVDGTIHPAKYENRNITSGVGKRLMTITKLHLELWLAEPGMDYTKEIARRFPNVAFWIK